MSACALSPSIAAPLVKRSLYREVVEEENKHKWIESEKAGYDLGEKCVQKWVADHWNGYLRSKWVEHLQGKHFWIELDRGDFGLLQRRFSEHRELLDTILSELAGGKENLDVIAWALANNVPLEPVFEILEALDINSRRLSRWFD